MQIEEETPGQAEAIGRLTNRAFGGVAYSTGTEAAIVAALRAAGALSLSLVALEKEKLLGHIAFSPVEIGTGTRGWHALGPVSVEPERQGRGIGRALIEAGLRRLRDSGAEGCVLLGDPAFYSRFGFVADGALTYDGASSPYLQALRFSGPAVRGEVRFHPGFSAR